MLLIDIGNTRLKWTVTSPGGGPLHPSQALDHKGAPAKVIRTLKLPKADRVWIAHVLGPKQEAAIARAVKARCGRAPKFARTQAECLGLRVAYEEPKRLGVDRWLTMLGLWHTTGGAFCVAGAGTALTFDAVDESGQHLGGLIAPGLTTAQKAVDGATRFRIRNTPASYAASLGRDTESCVRLGALAACVGLAEHAARHAAGARFLTGGDASVLLTPLGRSWEWRPNAVLEGLRVLAGQP